MAKTNLCQSCGIPLKDETDFGTEKDGTLSTKYCEKCYQDGEWTKTDLDFDGMYAYNLKKFQESDMNKIEKFFLNKMYTKKFMKKLERWN
ncbi:zinc ribbon domain-containing protein [Carnobacterium maltaromaticum]|uniref:zinc ribbon domain-containing protein n=1 Tax=Carnobacterium maltaromaticum TaxID=2751 RepID=UPI0039B00998